MDHYKNKIINNQMMNITLCNTIVHILVFKFKFV